MNDADLTKFSGEHLLHEFKMFRWASGAVYYMDGHLHDAVVESWVGHLRNLILFFCGKRDKDDVIAADFFDNPDDWKQSESKTLEEARVRANKELSHLTESRRYVGDPTKPWEVHALSAVVWDIAQRFAAKASSKKLHSDVKELLTAPTGKIMAVAGKAQASNVTSQSVSTSSQTANTGTWSKF